MSQNSKSADLAQSMKDGMRRLVSGVSVISAQDQSNKAYVMTVSSVTSVSDDPPSLLVCINKSTKIAPVLVPGQGLLMNVLGTGHKDVSVVCSTGEQNEQRLATGNWSRNGEGIPVLTDAEAVFECVVDELHSYGTHNIVVAKILSVAVSPNEPEPLVYANADYHTLQKATD